MFRRFKITQRFLLAIGLAICVVYTLGFLVAQQGTSSLFDELEKSELRRVTDTVMQTIEGESLRAQSMAAVVAHTNVAQQAFAARDRDRLKAMFGDGFADLKETFGVRQFQFHEPPATSFLRVHKLEKFGDDLSSFRRTVVASNNGKVPIRGLEVGVAGLGIRGIVPMVNDGVHQGTVEFGLSLGQDFVARVAAAHGIDIEVFLQRSGGLEAFAGTLEAGSMLMPDALAKVTENEPLFVKREVGGKPYGVFATPLKDYSGTPIGVVVVGKDRTAFAAHLASMFNRAFLAALISALALLGLVWFIVRGVVRPLRAARDSMQAIAYGSGNLTDRLDEQGADEVADLARAYNVFVDKLEQTVNSVVAQTRQLETMVANFSSVSEHTSSGTRRQQEQVTQVATAMNEMSATVHEVAQNTVDTADAARAVDTQSSNGRDVVRSAMESINRLADEVGSAVGRIQAVEQDSQRIGSVLDVIRGIAEQTNLLALNAAIEAARAGEQGRGFAVVADEVRTLAQRTQQSTSEIQEMIESLQGGVQSTVQVLQSSQQQARDSVEHAAQANDALDAINVSIDRISTMSAQIATAAEEQSAVAEDINRSIVDITHVADTTARDADRNVSETAHLAEVVESLAGLMGQFRTGDHQGDAGRRTG